MKIFTVYDSKAEAYLQPFYAPATGAGVRIFTEASNNQEHQFHRHGADYTLFEIGEWNENTGTLAPFDAKQSLGTAQELGETYSHTTEDGRTVNTVGKKHPDYEKMKLEIRGGE